MTLRPGVLEPYFVNGSSLQLFVQNMFAPSQIARRSDIKSISFWFYCLYHQNIKTQNNCEIQN